MKHSNLFFQWNFFHNFIVLYTKAYWFSTALSCPFVAALVVILTEPPWITAGLVILCVCRLCDRRRPSLTLGELARCIELLGNVGLLTEFTKTTKFVNITSEGPPLSRGIGLARKCSNISKMLWNHRCWTRHWPSTLSASLRCWKYHKFNKINA